MEVSTFELLVKRIAPSPPAPKAVARRVVQGYFLTISNLENQAISYKLEFNISKPNPADPDRTLVNNAEILMDIAGANTPVSLLPTGATVNTTKFTTASFVIPAKQTASIQLLPILGKALLTAANPDLEVRGFVRLRVPPEFRFNGKFWSYGPQSKTPVKVLLNPEIRGTFLPNEFPPQGGDFDQINYPLALASGQGLNEVPPEKGGFVTFPPSLIPEVLESLPERFQPATDLSGLAPERQVEALVDVLGQVEPTPENLQSITDVLSKLGIPIEMKTPQ